MIINIHVMEKEILWNVNKVWSYTNRNAFIVIVIYFKNVKKVEYILTYNNMEKKI